jgi:hypothetical protein
VFRQWERQNFTRTTSDASSRNKVLD